MNFAFVNHWGHTRHSWVAFFRNDHLIVLGIQWDFEDWCGMGYRSRIEFTLLNFGLEITWRSKEPWKDRYAKLRKDSPIQYATKTDDNGDIIKVPRLKPLAKESK